MLPTLIQINPLLIELKVLPHTMPKLRLQRELRNPRNKRIKAVCVHHTVRSCGNRSPSLVITNCRRPSYQTDAIEFRNAEVALTKALYLINTDRGVRSGGGKKKTMTRCCGGFVICFIYFTYLSQLGWLPYSFSKLGFLPIQLA